MHKALVFALIFASTAASAQTWQWKDASGNTIISDTPPPGNTRTSRTIGGRGPAVISEKPAETPNGNAAAAANGPKSAAEKDMEFRKRQQEAREKSEKDAKEQQLARERQENCERARRNLTALESEQPMSTTNERGERQMLDQTARTQEIERARRIMAETCSK